MKNSYKNMTREELLAKKEALSKEYVKQIIQDILTMLYQYSGISIICSVLIILVWKQAEEDSWKSIWVRLKILLQDHRWRKRFFFVLYIVRRLCFAFLKVEIRLSILLISMNSVLSFINLIKIASTFSSFTPYS